MQALEEPINQQFKAPSIKHTDLGNIFKAMYHTIMTMTLIIRFLQATHFVALMPVQ